MDRYVTLDAAGRPHRLYTGYRPHSEALPVRYPPVAESPITHHIRQRPISEWDVKSDHVIVTYHVTEKDSAVRKEALISKLADHRFEIETGGVKLLDGSRILTDRESQAQLTSAYQSLTQPFVDDIDWKGPDGWVTVTEVELRPIAQAVARHVQGCFTAERRVSELLAGAENAEALHAINIRQEFEEALEAIKVQQAAATETTTA